MFNLWATACFQTVFTKVSPVSCMSPFFTSISQTACSADTQVCLLRGQWSPLTLLLDGENDNYCCISPFFGGVEHFQSEHHETLWAQMRLQSNQTLILSERCTPRPLTWTSPGSAGTGLRPILDRRCRIRWYIFQRGSSCRTVSPGRREWTARSKTKRTPPSICWCPAGGCGLLVWVRRGRGRVWSYIPPQDPFFLSRSSEPSERPGPLGSAFLGASLGLLRLLLL